MYEIVLVPLFHHDDGGCSSLLIIQSKASDGEKLEEVPVQQSSMQNDIHRYVVCCDTVVLSPTFAISAILSVTPSADDRHGFCLGSWL